MSADMRKLMETVAPLFESHPFKDQLYDRYNDLAGDHGDNPEVRALLDKANAAFKDGDLEGAMHAVKQGEQVAMKSEGVVTEESNVEAIEELEHILDELERLGEQARYLVRSISREAEQQLAAYGAFDFGSSSNQYDVTLAGFVDDVQSGSYDDE
jgi:hypothetical protein